MTVITSPWPDSTRVEGERQVVHRYWLDRNAKVGRTGGIHDTPIEALNLGPRAYDVVRYVYGAQTIGDLLEYTEEELLSAQNFGRISLKEVKDAMAQYGLELKEG